MCIEKNILGTQQAQEIFSAVNISSLQAFNNDFNHGLSCPEVDIYQSWNIMVVETSIKTVEIVFTMLFYFLSQHFKQLSQNIPSISRVLFLSFTVMFWVSTCL